MRASNLVLLSVVSLFSAHAIAGGEINRKLESMFEAGRVPQGKDVASQLMCFTHDSKDSSKLKYVAIDPILISSGKFVRDELGEGMVQLAPAGKSLLFKKKMEGGHQHFTAYRIYKSALGPRLMLEESEFTGSKSAGRKSATTEAPIQNFVSCVPRDQIFSFDEESKFADLAKDLFAAAKKPAKKDLARGEFSCFQATPEAGVEIADRLRVSPEKNGFVVNQFNGQSNVVATLTENSVVAEAGEGLDVSKASFRVASTKQGSRLVREVSKMEAQASGERSPSSQTKQSYAVCLPTRELKNIVFGEK